MVAVYALKLVSPPPELLPPHTSVGGRPASGGGQQGWKLGGCSVTELSSICLRDHSSLVTPVPGAGPLEETPGQGSCGKWVFSAHPPPPCSSISSQAHLPCTQSDFPFLTHPTAALLAAAPPPSSPCTERGFCQGLVPLSSGWLWTVAEVRGTRGHRDI